MPVEIFIDRLGEASIPPHQPPAPEMRLDAQTDRQLFLAYPTPSRCRRRSQDRRNSLATVTVAASAAPRR